jgi:hypothetical protein
MIGSRDGHLYVIKSAIFVSLSFFIIPTCHWTMQSHIKMSSMKKECAQCGIVGAVQRCSRCRLVHNCSRGCQVRTHWRACHKHDCVRVNTNLEVEPTTEMIQKMVLVDSFAPVIPYVEDKERDNTN